jgi:hypothetical protein
MVREELVEMEKAEDTVKEKVKKRVNGEVTGDVNIESTEFTAVGNIPVYEIKCSASVISPTGKKHFKAQVNAESGKVIGFKEEWFEPTGGVTH